MRKILLLIFVLTALSGLTQTKPDGNAADSNFHLYLLLGQSNMAGRGVITDEYKTQGNPAIFMLNKSNEWVPAHHPLHFDKSVAGVGPGFAFAVKMADEQPNVKIGLVPCAVGGTSINSWQPDGYDDATKTHPYDDAVARIRAAMKSGVVKGMLWHQGESDSSPSAAGEYLPKLQKLIERIRLLTGNPQLPVVTGELGRYKESYQTINHELEKLPGATKYTAVASSEDLVHKGDSTHFDSPSADILGQRFAEKMILLQHDIQKGNIKH